MNAKFLENEESIGTVQFWIEEIPEVYADSYMEQICAELGHTTEETLIFTGDYAENPDSFLSFASTVKTQGVPLSYCNGYLCECYVVVYEEGGLVSLFVPACEV